MPSKWLFKEDPEHYSFERLVSDRRTTWDGVENNLALKNLRRVKTGDLILFYHSGKEKSVIGIMKAASGAYPDPGAGNMRLVVVDVVPVEKLEKPVPLSRIKVDKRFSDFELVKLPRLTVMPVSEPVWDALMRMARD